MNRLEAAFRTLYFNLTKPRPVTTTPLYKQLPWLQHDYESRDPGVIYSEETPAFWQRGIIVETGIQYAVSVTPDKKFHYEPVSVSEGACCAITPVEACSIHFLMHGKCPGVASVREVTGSSMVVNIPKESDVQDFLNEATRYKLTHGTDIK